MKASRLHRGQQANDRLADDVLTITALEARLFGHAGFPEAADALAYDAVQRILAVGTRDGRVKIFGSDGVECTFRSPFQTATKQLQFLENKGALLRLTTDGDAQLWGIEAGGFVDSLSNPEEDLITTVCPLFDEPYVLLGCKSGKVQAATLLGSSGSPAGGAREAASLQKLPYEVSPETMAGARGSIVALACSSIGSLHRVIVVHSGSSPLVWDLRYKSVVVTTEAVLLPASSQAESAPAAPRKMSWRPRARTQAAEPEQDAATCACWLSNRGDLFAVGYTSGVVRLYSIPDAALGEAPPAVPIQATLQRELKPCPSAEAALPIRAVWHVPGSKASEQSSILILGGQGTDEPDMLHVLPLEPPADVEEHEQHPLPWFGAIQGLVLVPPQHSLDVRSEPAALMTLNEGGQLIVYDMKTLKPLPLFLPLQELPPITASAFLHDAPPPEEDEERPHAFTAADLRALHAASAESPERAAAHRWRWMLSGGKLPELDSLSEAQPLLLTGHRDGRVRMWDMSCEVPRLLGTAPHDMGGPGSRLQAVSVIKVCQASGLLLVGHAKGEARLYQYTSTAQHVTAADISSESREEPEMSSSDQPAGFQLVLKVTLHEAAISAAALCSRAGLLALADHAGSLSLVDLNRLTVLCSRQLAEQPITALGLGTHSMHPQRAPGAKRPEALDSSAEDRLVLCGEAADCSLILLDARSGKPLNSSSKDPWLRPRHADSALGMFLLNDAGLPACPSPGDCVLPWAQNTRDTHGISLHPHSSMSGEMPPQDTSSWESPTVHARGAHSFREATSFPESEASSTGATAGTGKPEPKQAAGEQHTEEQPAQKWHALAAKVNSETAESQCSMGTGLDALRMSLSAQGSPTARDNGAHPFSETKQGSPGLDSPKYWQDAADIQVTSKRGSWVSGDVDSSVDELEADDDADDDNDDLLSAAVAAAEAEDKESKKSKKRFGLLKKAAKKEDSHKERKESNAEHHAKDQPRKEGTPGREFSQQQKRALGRWVRSSIDKGKPANDPSTEQPTSEAPDGQSSAAAGAVPVHSPFADAPANEPPPGRRAAPAPAAASEDREQPAAGEGYVHPGVSAGSQEEQGVSAPLHGPKPGMGRQTRSVGQEHSSSSSLPPKTSAMSSTQSTGLPSPAARMAIRGSVSDNSHERFAPPHADDEAPEASSSGIISHVVLASGNHLRLYTIENVREADRTTAKKVDLSQPIAFAGVFASQRGPGLACLSPTGILHVFALPGLELLLCQELQDGLTFPWAWKPEQAQLTRAATVAQDGQLAMVSACGELARLGLVAGTPEPAAATSLYDWDLATAALAASHAVKRQLDASLAQSRPTQQPSPQLKEPPASGSMAAAAPGRKGFGSFLSHVKDAASRVVDDTSKNFNQGLDILGARGNLGSDRTSMQTAPSLADVLSSEPEAKSPDAQAAMGSSAASSAAVAKQQQVDEEAQRSELSGSQGKRAGRPQTAAESALGAIFGGKEAHGKPAQDESASQEPDAAAGRGGKHLWSEDEEVQRAGLFKGAKTGAGKAHAGANPGVRTADDIKAAYGRPSNTKRAEGLSGVMDENRARLAERGEKLRGLQDKMEAMSSDAEGFASMAKQLRDREANKKWWQI